MKSAKGIHSDRRIICGIIAILPQIQPLKPCSLLTCNIMSQIPLHPFIHYFGLTIHLQVIASTESSLCTCQLENLLPKGAKKPAIPITHNSLG